MLRACEKRPVSLNQLEQAIDEIEQSCQNSLVREVSSQKLGEYALAKLREIDQVAYVRFASVYHQFQDIHSFLEELNNILDSNIH